MRVREFAAQFVRPNPPSPDGPPNRFVVYLKGAAPITRLIPGVLPHLVAVCESAEAAAQAAAKFPPGSAGVLAFVLDASHTYCRRKGHDALRPFETTENLWAGALPTEPLYQCLPKGDWLGLKTAPPCEDPQAAGLQAAGLQAAEAAENPTVWLAYSPADITAEQGMTFLCGAPIILVVAGTRRRAEEVRVEGLAADGAQSDLCVIEVPRTPPAPIALNAVVGAARRWLTAAEQAQLRPK